MLLMASELLCYCPADGDYDAWLNRVVELLDAACGGMEPFCPPPVS